MFKTLSPEQFRDRIFDILRRKQHWATSGFQSNTITKKQLNIFFHQEYVVYVRDFSVLLAQVLGKNPPWEARRRLATIIYEEETGGFSLGRPHQELFLHMMNGLGFNRAGFRDVELLAPSRTYREWLNQVCQEDDWTLGAAVLTIFIKGTSSDPEEVLYPQPAQNQSEIEDLIKKYALVQHQGLSLECMDYIRAQHMFEPGSRKLIYDMIMHQATEKDQQELILTRLEEALTLWGRYQDGIARACGIRQK
ncbi:MAG: iron-containing redox enzyme family protein [Nitrospirota bacterium]|nr:iron-containing redox enzyme family protein [Nitrospirota bacterium]